MAHAQQHNYIAHLRTKWPQHYVGQPVLEVGSLDINGSVRQFFTDCDYTGVDLAPGPGVDVVCAGQDLAWPDGSFGTVITTECFEHNPYWQMTFDHMLRVCRPGGLMIMTCATTGRAEHGTARTTPSDSPLTVARGWHYYQNLTQADFERHWSFDLVFDSYEWQVDHDHHDLYFWGIRANDTV